MTNLLTFASFGGGLKVFTFELSGNFTENAAYSTGYSPHGKARQFSLAGNGLWICGPPDDSSNIPVFKFEDRIKLTRMRHVPNVCAATFMTHTNKHLAVATDSGSVKLWDVKQKSVYKTLCEKGPEPVKYVDASWDDNFIAACGDYSETPSIKIYGVTTSRLMHTLSLDAPSQFSGLKFSSVKKSSLACSTMEGRLMIWDVHKASVIMERKDAHIGSCTGLALSPINHSVLASISLGGTFLLHDARVSKTVSEIHTDSRLTSVDLVREQPQVLLGTADGRIMLFDLRNCVKIAPDLQAHGCAVDCIRVFQGLQATSKPIEELAVNTPDEPIAVKPTLDMSVADVCTPPSTMYSVLPRSAAGKALSSLDVVSPIIPSSACRTSTAAAHSTPNPVVDTPTQANTSDSFLKLIASPVGISPRPLSTLSFASTGFLQRKILNGIKEEQERVTSPLSDPPLRLPYANGVALSSPATSTDTYTSLRDIIKEAFREEMNELRSFFKSEIESLKVQGQEIKSEVDNLKGRLNDIEDSLVRNREHTIYTYQTVGQLSNVIRLANAYADVIGEFDHDPSFFRENK